MKEHLSVEGGEINPPESTYEQYLPGEPSGPIKKGKKGYRGGKLARIMARKPSSKGNRNAAAVEEILKKIKEEEEMRKKS